jgi:hypothetical protein
MCDEWGKAEKQGIGNREQKNREQGTGNRE